VDRLIEITIQNTWTVAACSLPLVFYVQYLAVLLVQIDQSGLPKANFGASEQGTSINRGKEYIQRQTLGLLNGIYHQELRLWVPI
jgi:hypothetical protein